MAYALRELGRTAGILQRQVGRPHHTPRRAPEQTRSAGTLPAAQQRKALDVLIQSYLSTDAVAIPATLQRRLAPDYLERADASQDDAAGAVATDFSVADQMLQRQREVLAFLMSEGLADRLSDNLDKVRDREKWAGCPRSASTCAPSHLVIKECRS